MENIKDFIDFINEDTSAVGGPSCGSGDGGGGGEAYGNASSMGMGAVVSAQPSSFAGSTQGPAWSNGGGTIGSGDVNSNGRKKPYTKIPAKYNNKLKNNNRSLENYNQDRAAGFIIKQMHLNAI